MELFTVRGIVIKTVNIGESDRIITLLTPDNGLLSVSVKGARRTKSGFVACSQFLCYGEYTIARGRAHCFLKSANINRSFFEIGNDIERLTYASHMVDIAYDAAQEDQPAEDILNLLLNSLHLLCLGKIHLELLTAIYEIRILTLLGHVPFTEGCIVCGRKDSPTFSFSFKKGGFLCDKSFCTETDSNNFKMISGTANALYYITHSQPQKLFKFNVSNEVQEQLKYIARRFINEQFDANYKKLDFLNSI